MKTILFDLYDVIYIQELDAVNLEIVEIMQFLYEKEYPLYLFTNSSEKRISEINKKHDFLRYLVSVFSAVENPKPLSFTYMEIQKKLNISPSEIILIDDKEENINTAKSFGWQGIIYRDIENLRNNLKRILKHDI